MLQPLGARYKGKQVRFACNHWKHWPPSEAFLDMPIEEMRRAGILDARGYGEYQVWERVCGLLRMEEPKCRECPHVRLAEIRNHLPSLVSLDGKFVVPLVDREGERLARGNLVTGIRFPQAK